MKLLQSPASEGLAWVRRAFQVFFRQPFGFAALFAACAMVFFVLVSVPLLGELVLLVLAPTGTLLFMIATRRTLAGDAPLPGTFKTVMSAGRPRLLGLAKLGVAYLAAALLAFWLIAAVDGGAMSELMDTVADTKTGPDATAARLADPRLQWGVLLRFGLGALLSVPFWHAPALVFWGGHGWAKALFASSIAVWRNKAAFLAYGLAWAALAAMLAMLLGVVVGMMGAQRATFLATPLVMLFSTVFYASLWFTFTGCFADEKIPSERLANEIEDNPGDKHS